MLRVKYERYWNDFHRRNEVKHFADLDELAEWMFGQMQQDYTGGMSFPTPEKASRIGESGPWAIELRPVWGGETSGFIRLRIAAASSSRTASSPPGRNIGVRPLKNGWFGVMSAGAVPNSIL